jgi:hypothetical protein
MTSTLFNPSKKIAEILSEFLEFDPNQLLLGLWSGDLSLKDVGLRCDTINAYLNEKVMYRGLQLKLVLEPLGICDCEYHGSSWSGVKETSELTCPMST